MDSRTLLQQDLATASWEMNARPRWLQQHKHAGLINRRKAFSGATLAANAFLTFQGLIEFENEDTKSFICLFTDNSSALKWLFPLITASPKEVNWLLCGFLTFKFIYMKYICKLKVVSPFGSLSKGPLQEHHWIFPLNKPPSTFITKVFSSLRKVAAQLGAQSSLNPEMGED